MDFPRFPPAEDFLLYDFFFLAILSPLEQNQVFSYKTMPKNTQKLNGL
jgi:hypothetical protein